VGASGLRACVHIGGEGAGERVRGGTAGVRQKGTGVRYNILVATQNQCPGVRGCARPAFIYDPGPLPGAGESPGDNADPGGQLRTTDGFGHANKCRAVPFMRPATGPETNRRDQNIFEGPGPARENREFSRSGSPSSSGWSGSRGPFRDSRTPGPPACHVFFSPEGFLRLCRAHVARSALRPK
jgi:hypothetical protein